MFKEKRKYSSNLWPSSDIVWTDLLADTVSMSVDHRPQGSHVAWIYRAPIHNPGLIFLVIISHTDDGYAEVDAEEVQARRRKERPSSDGIAVGSPAWHWSRYGDFKSCAFVALTFVIGIES